MHDGFWPKYFAFPIRSIGTKLCIYNLLYNSGILPIFLYGADTLVVTVSAAKTFDVLDHWCLRRILNIGMSVGAHRQRNEVQSRTRQPPLSDTVRARRPRLFGHVCRADSTQNHSLASRACVSGLPKNWKRRPGWPRQTWLQTVEVIFAHSFLPPGVCISACTEQNRLARYRRNGYVDDKPG